MQKILRNGLEIVYSYFAPGRILYRNGHMSAAVIVSVVVTIFDFIVVYFVFFDIPDNSAQVKTKLNTATTYILLRVLLVIFLKFAPRPLLLLTPEIRSLNMHFLPIFLAIYPIVSLGTIISIHLFKLSAWGFYQDSSPLSLPTIYPNDVIVIEHNYFKKYAARRGELVVYERAGNLMISRIAAIAGDTISVQDGSIFVNGQNKRLQAMKICVPVADKLYQAVEEGNDAGKYTVLIGECDVRISYRLNMADVFGNEAALILDNRAESGRLASAVRNSPIDSNVFKVRASSLVHRPKFIYRSSSEGRTDIKLSE